jgi:hypothetical protein
MSLSPRLRADYLLLGTPTPQRCIEAFTTVEGASMYAGYPNIVARAATVFSELPVLIDAALPAELIAARVSQFLDGGYTALQAPEVVSIEGLLPD